GPLLPLSKPITPSLPACASSPSSLTPRPTADSLRSPPPSPNPTCLDDALAATALKWTVVEDFVMNLAIALPGSSQTFIKVYGLPCQHPQALKKLESAADLAAKSHLDGHFDTATALLTRFEKVDWREAVIRYVTKGPELDEATAKIDGSDTPFDGALVTANDVRKKRRRQKNAGRASALSGKAGQVAPGQSKSKRKRDTAKSIKEEAKELAARTRNAGIPYVVPEADRHLFVKYLAELPPSSDWNKALGAFVENGNSGYPPTFPAWGLLLRKEKAWFEHEVAAVRANASPHPCDTNPRYQPAIPTRDTNPAIPTPVDPTTSARERKKAENRPLKK
ncbi:hypothetical protein FRC01_006533, partial [Tulasnella sp. 417]